MIIIIIVSAYIHFIKVEIEVNKLYYHIAVDKIKDGFSWITRLSGFIQKESKDAPLKPMYIVQGQQHIC